MTALIASCGGGRTAFEKSNTVSLNDFITPMLVSLVVVQDQ